MKLNIPTNLTKDEIAEAISKLTEQMKTAPDTDESVYIWAIIDRSGSMGHLVDDTINGFNYFIKEQAESDAGEAYLTTMLFDHEHMLINEKVNVKTVAPLSKETYVPRGSTALYDAIGKTLKKALEANKKNNIVIILTDGFENCSSEFNNQSIKSMISECETQGWKFIYLGANQDAFAVSQGLGILRGASVNYAASGEGIKTAYYTASSFTANARVDYLQEASTRKGG